MLVIAVTAVLAYLVFVYSLTGWDAKKFTGENLTIFGYATSIMLGIVAPTLIYGTKPIWDSYPRKAEKKTTSEKVIEHTRAIIEKLDQLRNKQISEKPGLQYAGIWIHTFDYFADLSDLLYHLYTDRRELFDILVNALQKNNMRDPQFDSRMGELVKSVVADGDKLKGCSPSCKGMFPTDDAKAFEQQFKEFEQSELWNTPRGKLWLRKR